jgi:hypothetical protein
MVDMGFIAIGLLAFAGFSTTRALKAISRFSPFGGLSLPGIKGPRPGEAANYMDQSLIKLAFEFHLIIYLS